MGNDPTDTLMSTARWRNVGIHTVTAAPRGVYGTRGPAALTWEEA
jgi:hypothetical protein